MGFDPRDYDSRDYDSRDDRLDIDRRRDDDRSSRHDVGFDDDARRPDTHLPDRDDREGGARSGQPERDTREDPRWPDRDADVRARDADPRDVFTRDLHLPRHHEREIVHYREHAYTLRGSESRTLATVGAFRVVSSRDLRDHDGRQADARVGDLRHLREQGLIRTERLDGHREPVVVLTKDARKLLESHRRDHSHERHRDAEQRRQQAFYAELKKPREVEHDVQVFRAYLREAERLAERGDRIERVVLDYELKRDYQKWLHERDRERDEPDGRPDRTPAEIEEWAREQDLPYFDDQVHFPDVRIEYEQPDGRWDHVDVEVLTPHYRGAHGSAAARSGFSAYRGGSARLGGGGRSGGGRGPTGAGLAERL